MSIPGELILITGPIGSGKTTFCSAAIAWAGLRGWQAAGLVSPPVFQNGIKIGIDVLDVRSGQLRRLANLRLKNGGEITTERWKFNPEVLRWGNQVLAHMLPCDLLVLDELGPLEFERGQGWITGLSVLDTRSYRLGLATIRPGLLGRAQERWPFANVMKMQSVDEVTEKIAAWLDPLAER